jgi:hypothetical protein
VHDFVQEALDAHADACQHATAAADAAEELWSAAAAAAGLQLDSAQAFKQVGLAAAAAPGQQQQQVSARLCLQAAAVQEASVTSGGAAASSSMSAQQDSSGAAGLQAMSGAAANAAPPLPPDLALLSGAVQAVLATEQQAYSAAWPEQLTGGLPSAQALFTAAPAAMNFVSDVNDMRELAVSYGVPDAFEGWEQGLAEEIKQTIFREMHAAEFLAMAYHARVSCGIPLDAQ